MQIILQEMEDALQLALYTLDQYAAQFVDFQEQDKGGSIWRQKTFYNQKQSLTTRY